MKEFLLIAALSLVQADPAPDMSEAESLAREYMVHYSAFDLDAMETYLAEDVIFSDPTALGEGLGEDGLYHDSREDIMTALREFDAQYAPLELGFEWDTVFESNGRVVFMGHVNSLYATDDPDQNFRWRAPQVTVITVRDGEIVRQDDFANYANPLQGLVPVQ